MGYVGNNSLSKIGSWVKTKLKAWYIAYDNRASGLLSNAVQYAIDEVLGKVWETERNIAPMEYSPAESSHAVGEYITYNDHLYKVISAISIGQTLQIGTNIQQVSMGNEITDLNSDLLTYLKKNTVSITTSASGSARLENNLNHLVIAATPNPQEGNDSVVMPIVGLGGAPWVKVFNWNMQPVINTTMSIVYYYIDLSEIVI